MRRILIVDDHSVVRRGLQQILEEEFGVVEFGEAGDAQQAMEQIWRSDWDVVILDLTLPGRSGLEVLRDSRQAKPRMPVLVLSMHPEDQYAVRVLRAGAAGYLTKEAAPDELGKAVRKVLAGRKYVSPALAEELAASLLTDGDRPPHELLSDREYEVMLMIASGQSVSDIAATLSLSVNTISTYRARVLKKMGMRNNSELTAYAFKHGLVD